MISIIIQNSILQAFTFNDLIIVIAVFILLIFLGIQQIINPHLFIMGYDYMKPRERNWRVVFNKISGVLFIVAAIFMLFYLVK